MQHTIKDLESGAKELTLTVSKEEMQPHYAKAYSEVRKSISLPGFRRGKVPNHIIKNMYGKQLEMEAAQDAGNDFFGQFLDEGTLDLAGTPKLIDIKFEDDGSVSYVLEVDLMPIVDLKDYTNLTVDEPSYTVTEEDVEKEIYNIRREYGSFEEAQKIEDEDYVITYTLVEVDSETEEPVDPDAEPEEKNADLLKGGAPEEIKNAVIGMVKGESKIVELSNPRDPESKTKFLLEITHVDKPVPAELTDEFAKERSDGKFETAEDFRYDMQLKIQEEWDKQSRQAVEKNIMEAMIEMHGDFDVPEEAVEQQATQMVRNLFLQMMQREPAPEDIKPEYLEPYKPMAKTAIQWEIIRKSIVEQEGVEVDDFDLEELFEEEMGKMGDSGIEGDKKEELLKHFKNDQRIKDQLLNKKVLDLLYDYAETNEVDFEGNPVDDEDIEEEDTEEENDKA